MHRTFCAPFHPTGMTFGPLRSPRGLKIPQLHPLMDEFPIGDRGSGPVAIKTHTFYYLYRWRTSKLMWAQIKELINSVSN